MCRDTFLRLFVSPPLCRPPPSVLLGWFLSHSRSAVFGNLLGIISIWTNRRFSAAILFYSSRPRQGLTDPCRLYLKAPGTKPGTLLSYLFALDPLFVFWRPTWHHFYLGQQTLLGGDLVLLVTTSLRPRQGLTDLCSIQASRHSISLLLVLVSFSIQLKRGTMPSQERDTFPTTRPCTSVSGDNSALNSATV